MTDFLLKMEYTKWSCSRILVVDIDEIVKSCSDCLASQIVECLLCALRTRRAIGGSWLLGIHFHSALTTFWWGNL